MIAALDATVTSNRDSSNALKPIFNKQKIEAGFAIAGTLAREAGTFLAHRCQEISQRKERADELMGRAEDVSQALSPSERLTLRREAKQLNQQAAEQEQCWGPGGHYRQITTALLAAVGGNITAGTGVLVQAAAVNYLQQNLAKEVGNLVARGMLTEGSPFHASLHALIAAGGAAASGQDVVSAAGGSAAASLLTNLFEPPTPDSTEEEKTAKRHLLTTLVTGIADAVGGDATAASSATLANIDNNWLTVPAPVAVPVATVATAGDVAALFTVDKIIAALGITVGQLATAIATGALLLWPSQLGNGERPLSMLDTEAVIAGRKRLDQIAAESGAEHANLVASQVEVTLMRLAGWDHLNGEEQTLLGELVRKSAPPEQCRPFLEEKLNKYCQESIAELQKLFPSEFTERPGFSVPEFDFPIHTGHPAPDVDLPNHTGGNQIPEKSADLYIFVPADPTLTQPPPVGVPVDVPRFPIVVAKKQGGDKETLQQPQWPYIDEPVGAENGLDLHTNKKHAPCTGEGDPRSGKEPKNSLELFEDSKMLPGDKHRYTKGDDGKVHRFAPTRDKLFHWNGSTGDEKNPLKLDNKVKARLNKEFGWNIKK